MRIKATCECCGRQYWKTNGQSKYCSEACKTEMAKQRYQNNKEERLEYAKKYREELKKKNPNYERDRWREIRGTVEYERECEICGTAFSTTRPQKVTCSTECSKKRKNKKRHERMTKADRHKHYVRTRYGSEEARQAYLKEVEAKKEQARQQRAKEKEARKISGTCCVCGEPFETFNPAQKTCSKKCSRKYANAKKDRRIPKEQRIDKDITLEALYRRDSGVCYLCGKKCDWNDKAGNVVGPLYPSIDHVVPVSKGGFHSWDNVLLAHFECNVTKSDTLEKDLIQKIPTDAYKLKKNVEPHKKQTIQKTKNGEVIAVFESTADAARQTGFKAKQIQNVARGEHKSYRGFLWGYV